MAAVMRHMRWSAIVKHKTDFGNTSLLQAFSFAPVHLLSDVSKLFILLVQALSFDQTFVMYNLEISFLEGQELSNSKPYQINPNKVVTAQDKSEPKLEFQSICTNYYFSKTTVLALTREEKRGKMVSSEPSIKLLC